jgi:hypothetical protein
LPSTSASVTAGPPSSETRFSLRSAKKASSRPSGENVGCHPPSVPWIGVASTLATSRR